MCLESENAWNPVWDSMFRSRLWGRYPSEELVALVSRTFGSEPDRGAIRLLELGCGPGANVWFMAREGYQVWGIDGSQVAIDRASERMASEGLRADLRVADLVSLPFENDWFNGVFDMGAIQHNLCRHRDSILAEAHRVLMPGGIMFSSLMGHGSWGEGTGTKLESGTYDGIQEGPGVGSGALHFFKEAEFPELFQSFADLTYERRTQTRNGRTRKVVHWFVTAMKPSRAPGTKNSV